MRPTSLGRRAIEVFVAVVGGRLGRVNHAVLVVRRPVDRVELERLVARVDHIVLRACGHNDRVVGLNPRRRPIDPDLPLPFSTRKNWS